MMVATLNNSTMESSVLDMVLRRMARSTGLLRTRGPRTGVMLDTSRWPVTTTTCAELLHLRPIPLSKRVHQTIHILEQPIFCEIGFFLSGNFQKRICKIKHLFLTPFYLCFREIIICRKILKTNLSQIKMHYGLFIISLKNLFCLFRISTHLAVSFWLQKQLHWKLRRKQQKKIFVFQQKNAIDRRTLMPSYLYKERRK